jgi:hypothetical protein
MMEAFVEMVKTPSDENYRRIREMVLADASFDPKSRELEQADNHLQANEFDALYSIIGNAMPNVLLSPRAHMYMSLAAEERGDEDDAQLEQTIATACLAGLLATGDGNRSTPYLAIRREDEYDALRALEKEVTSQEHVEQDGRFFDVFRCTDGQDVWFDITDTRADGGDS